MFFATGILMLLKSNSTLSSNSRNESESPITPTNDIGNVIDQEKPNLNVPITMNKFERHETKDGKKLWEITAEKGRYIPQSNTAELENSKLLFYREDDSVVQLTSSNAKILFSGTELKGADLNGSVEVVYNDKVHIYAGIAQYNKAEDTIVVPGLVKINTDNMDLEGRDLTAYVSKHEVHISHDVSTVIQPRAKIKANSENDKKEKAEQGKKKA